MKKTALLASFLSPLLLLSGCMVGYQSHGVNGGHSFSRTGPDTFDVSYQSNTSLYQDQLHDYCMLRAAEVAIEYGFTHFAVEGELYSQVTQYMPTTSTTTVTVPPAAGSSSGSSSSGSGSSGGSASAKPTTATVTTTGATPMAFPVFTLRIKCYPTFPTATPHTGIVWDAEDVREEMAAKYGIPLY
ncbi:CC0125/CC1285 family lipoprotein [Actomonas aquatica]|uniref:Lipoprotein n=1 Tax=Actomonas aquatica TaxID=2866162 RepID=A0ABZ1CAE4_9BACT|nr:hypothetical protein [Opitutus sp. WL0086]WRQ88367.1 hypothetical protein K1X11_003055 [Opitutus sp. WL0086]